MGGSVLQGTKKQHSAYRLCRQIIIETVRIEGLAVEKAVGSEHQSPLGNADILRRGQRALHLEVGARQRCKDGFQRLPVEYPADNCRARPPWKAAYGDSRPQRTIWL